MAVESCNIPLPSEVILPYGGYLVSTGRLEFWWAALAGTAGGTAGSAVSYYIGLYGGRPFLNRYGRYFGVTPQKLALAERWFARYGEATVFFTRLLPVIRTFISLPAGVARMNFPRFLVYTFLGSLPWSLALTYVGYL
ncbi:MAG: DedA family protein, partial [Firmicutes bacterium]|nr:DedA family protein [Bacillota bacterium]